MLRRYGLGMMMVFTLGLLTPGAFAAEPAAKPTGFNERLVWLLNSEPTLSQPTIAEVREILERSPDAVIWPSTLWPMMKQGLVAEAEARATRALLAERKSLEFFDRYQLIRAQCLIRLGRHDEALSAARGYYNVCPMQDTGKAIELIAQALAGSRGADDPAIVRQFKQQQISGANTTPADPSASPAQPPADSILLAIPLDPKSYEPAIAELSGNGSYVALSLKGHFQLLAGQAGEARKTFELALDLARGNQLPAAIENVAKAIRAEAGAVGPANAYILKMRQAAE